MLHSSGDLRDIHKFSAGKDHYVDVQLYMHTYEKEEAQNLYLTYRIANN